MKRLIKVTPSLTSLFVDSVAREYALFLYKRKQMAAHGNAPVEVVYGL